jgi:hypothetical protein
VPVSKRIEYYCFRVLRPIPRRDVLQLFYIQAATSVLTGIIRQNNLARIIHESKEGAYLFRLGGNK